jgi:hypothetical protein
MKSRHYFSFIAITLSLFFTSCGDLQNVSCYDPSLVHNGACPEDCPGVCGCDGNTYCNECEANRVGIEVIDDRVCN